MINFEAPQLYFCLAVLALTLMVLWVRKKSIPYIMCFAVFGIYVIAVISVVVFPFPSPGLYVYPDLQPSIHLALFDFGDCQFLYLCLWQIYGNIILTIPFGFGVSFIARIKSNNILWLAIAVGMVFEITQFVISLIIRHSYRVADINDVIFNATGILLGYGIFKIFGWLYSAATHKFKIQHRFIFAYIYDVIHNPDH